MYVPWRKGFRLPDGGCLMIGIANHAEDAESELILTLERVEI